MSAPALKMEDGTLPSGFLSRLLGSFDLAYGVFARFKGLAVPSFRHWTHGWGDVHKISEVLDVVAACHEKHKQGPEFWGSQVKFPIETDVRAEQRILHGHLRSPLHQFLTPSEADVPFQVVLPDGKPWAIVVLCGGTGDESFLFRRKAFSEPLQAAGIASIIPLMPFYGSRRRSGQKLFYLQTFFDIVLQCYAGGCENCQLLDWAKLKFPDALLGVAGISHGAGAAVATVSFTYHDLALVSLLSPSSAGVLTKGDLVHDLALESLGAGGKSLQPSFEEVRDIVFMTLEQSVGPTNGGGSVQLPEQGRYVRCVTAVSAADDSFVPPENSRQAIADIKRIMPDSQIQHFWVPGGHVSSFLIARQCLSPMILRTFLRMRETLNTRPRTRL